jgi:hypothetical protein
MQIESTWETFALVVSSVAVVGSLLSKLLSSLTYKKLKIGAKIVDRSELRNIEKVLLNLELDEPKFKELVHEEVKKLMLEIEKDKLSTQDLKDLIDQLEFTRKTYNQKHEKRGA